MNKMFLDSAFLSEEGEQLVKPLRDALDQILSSPDVQAMSAQTLRVLKANLARTIGDTFCDAIREREKREEARAKNPFFKMTDDEFIAHLKQKYGEGYMFVTLTSEELDRVPVPDFETAMEEWKKLAGDAIRYPSTKMPDIYFK